MRKVVLIVAWSFLRLWFWVLNLALLQSKNGEGSGKDPESPLCILVNMDVFASF